MPQRIILQTIAIFATLTVLQSIAWACSCVEATQDTLDDADTVFFGTVTSVSSIGCGGQELAVTFDVIDADRGVSAGDAIELVTSDTGKGCGLVVEEGENWLIYATDERLSLCAGNLQTTTNPGFLLADR